MIIVDNALAKLKADGSPIRVAVVGAGFQGAAIVRQIVTSTRGMRVVGSPTGMSKKQRRRWKAPALTRSAAKEARGSDARSPKDVSLRQRMRRRSWRQMVSTLW
jgi:predicted homoserine dehydrogenase-like protein